jgi:hypothetical protein
MITVEVPQMMRLIDGHDLSGQKMVEGYLIRITKHAGDPDCAYYGQVGFVHARVLNGCPDHSVNVVRNGVVTPVAGAAPGIQKGNELHRALVQAIHAGLERFEFHRPVGGGMALYAVEFVNDARDTLAA